MGKHFISGRVISVDTETTGLDPWRGDAPFAVGFCNEEGRTHIFEWPVEPFTRKVLAPEDDLDAVRDFLADSSVTKVMHNSKFDIRMFEIAMGMPVAGTVHDSMIAARVCNSGEPAIGLKELADKYLRMPNTDETALKRATQAARRKAKTLGWMMGNTMYEDYWMCRAVDRKNRLCSKYLTSDVEMTMLMWLMYENLMEQDDQRLDNPGCFRKTYDKEMTLLQVVKRMEYRGVYLNLKALRRDRRKVHEELAAAKKELAEIVGPNFNPNSTQQVVKVLEKEIAAGRLPANMERTGVKTNKKGQQTGGAISTRILALVPHWSNRFVRTLLHFRAMNKVSSSFYDKYDEIKVPDHVTGHGFCLHPFFNQVGTITGRFSCHSPNLQQVTDAESKRTSETVSVRTPFGPRPGHVWYLIDYSQMEVRVFAECANEETMLAAIENDLDLHGEVAQKVWGGPNNLPGLRQCAHALDLYSPEPGNEIVAAAWEAYGWDPKNRLNEPLRNAFADHHLQKFDYRIVAAEKALEKKRSRTYAKTVLFCKLYGGSGGAIAGLLQMTRREAQQILNDFDRSFPTIKAYAERMIQEALANGEIINLYGRRVKVDRESAYKAVNYMIQGSCADLMKRSMINVDAFLRSTGLDWNIILTLHDELVFEVRKEHAYKWVLRQIKAIMEDNGGVLQRTIPVDIVRARESWAHKEKVTLVSEIAIDANAAVAHTVPVRKVRLAR